jgi:membrane protein DedA with SNARE-associated domain
VSISLCLITSPLVLSIVAGALASYFIGRRTARMKTVDILRRLCSYAQYVDILLRAAKKQATKIFFALFMIDAQG